MERLLDSRPVPPEERSNVFSGCQAVLHTHVQQQVQSKWERAYSHPQLRGRIRLTVHIYVLYRSVLNGDGRVYSGDGDSSMREKLFLVPVWVVTESEGESLPIPRKPEQIGFDRTIASW